MTKQHIFSPYKKIAKVPHDAYHHLLAIFGRKEFNCHQVGSNFDWIRFLCIPGVDALRQQHVQVSALHAGSALSADASFGSGRNVLGAKAEESKKAHL